VDFPLNEREPEDENPDIPAGFTYLGSSSITTSHSTRRLHSIVSTIPMRSSTSGPRVSTSMPVRIRSRRSAVHIDADGKRLFFGDDKDFDPRDKRPDLPRNTATPRRALIGDKRNDENVIVSQMHALFLRFRNAVLDTAAGGDCRGAADRAVALSVDRPARLHPEGRW
jgi:hypothetical protein